MLPPISINDFKGRLRISRNEFDEETLNDYINQFYEEYLIKLIGARAFKEIRNSSNPLRPKWNDLLNGVIYYDQYLKESYRLEGLIETIKRFIFFEISRDYGFMTNTGEIRNQNENAVDITPQQINAKAMSIYANSVEEYNCKVIPFFWYYEDTQQDITSFTFDGTSTWTITTDCTQYLQNGDKVKIDCIEYEVQNVVKNTSFTIQNTDPLFTISRLVFIYDPYEIVQFEKIYSVSY